MKTVSHDQTQPMKTAKIDKKNNHKYAPEVQNMNLLNVLSYDVPSNCSSFLRSLSSEFRVLRLQLFPLLELLRDPSVEECKESFDDLRRLFSHTIIEIEQARVTTTATPIRM